MLQTSRTVVLWFILLHMKQLFTALLLVCSLSLAAQETGIHFEHNTTWQAVLEKAKKENKYIFVDAFTTWCGPCKMMAKNIFPKPEVGEFFNPNFINLKVQLDTTKNDNAEVKAWYKDAHDIMVNYNVQVFPTYLFLDPNGKLVHRSVGSSDAATFIAKAKRALDPATQYFTLKEKFTAGDRTPALLKTLANAAMEAYDMPNVKVFADAYVATQQDLLTKENIEFLSKLTQSSQDKGFALMLQHTEAFDAVLGKGKTKNTVRAIILQEDVFPVIWSPTGKAFQWNTLQQDLQKKYGKTGEETAAYAQVFYYQQTGNWDDFAPAVTKFMQQYGSDLPAAELNSFAWAIFEHCSDMNCVEQAVEWAKKAAIEKDANYLDTYANLLYKSGKRKEAIAAQEQTIALAKATGNANVDDFEATLAKMKKGEKTW